MKIREIYTVVREYEVNEKSTIEDLKDDCFRALEDPSKSLCEEICTNESVCVQFQINKGNEWEDFDPEL